MNARESLLVYLTGLYVAVVGLALVLAAVLGVRPFGGLSAGGVIATTPVVALAKQTFGVLPMVALGVYLSLPVLLVAVARRTDIDGDRVLVGCGLAFLGPIALAVFFAGGFLLGFEVGQVVAVLVLVVGGPALGLLSANALGAFEGTAGLGRKPAAAIGLVLAVGVLVSLVAIGGGADALVTERERGSPPFIEFDVTANGSVVTVEHAGGDAILAEDLRIRGEGFATVEGVNQTSAGPWQGTVTRVDENGRWVSQGDTVTVGVESDCDLAIVARGDGFKTTLETYSCAG